MWQLVYCAGVWGLNIFTLVYILIKRHPSVFAVFVVITPSPPRALEIATMVVMTLSVVAHLITHSWCVNGDWRAPLLYRPISDSILLSESIIAHAEEDLQAPLLSSQHLSFVLNGRTNDISWLAGGFILTSIALLSVANYMNPGDWSPAMNVFGWGLGGAMFVWYPFVLPFGILIVESRTHSERMRAFAQVVRQLTRGGGGYHHREEDDGGGGSADNTNYDNNNNNPKDDLTAENVVGISCSTVEEDHRKEEDVTKLVYEVEELYWSIVADIESVTRRFRAIMPLQLLTLALSLLINVLQMYIAANSRISGKAVEVADDFMVLSVVITALMFVQFLVPMCAVAATNRDGIALQKALARVPEFIPLVNQSVWWPPAIVICGIEVSYRLIATVTPVLAFYCYNLVLIVSNDE